MTVYSGTIEYSGSASHLAGETRELTAGTNNPLVGQAFGADQVAPSGTTAQGKIAVIDLASGEIVRIDPREMTKIDDSDYLVRHASEIKNWGPAARLMWNQHRGELQALAARTAPMAKKVNYTNSVVKALTKLYLGVGDATSVKNAIAFDTDRPWDVLDDELSRQLVGATASHTFTLYGVTVHATMQITKFTNTTDDVTVNAELAQVRVLGSKSSITRVSDRKQQLLDFEAVKRAATDMTGQDFEFSSDFPDSDDDMAVAIEAKHDLIKQMKRWLADEEDGLAEYLIERTQDYGFDADFADDFNIASAYHRLWNELHFSGDVTKNGMDEAVMRQYWNHEITAVDVLLQASDKFVKKIKTALVNKFTRYVDVEAYASRALDAVSDDLHIKTSEQRTAWEAFATQATQEVLDQYVAAIQDMSNIEDLMSQYLAPIHEHSQEIINAIKQRLMAHQEVVAEDQGKDTTQAMKATFERYVLKLWEMFGEQNNIPAPVMSKLQAVPAEFIEEHEDPFVKKYASQTEFNDHLDELTGSLPAYFAADEHQHVHKVVEELYSAIATYILENHGDELKPEVNEAWLIGFLTTAVTSMAVFSYYGDGGAERLFQEHKDELAAEPAEQTPGEDLAAQYEDIEADVFYGTIAGVSASAVHQAFADHPAIYEVVESGFGKFGMDQILDDIDTTGGFYSHMKAFRNTKPTLEEYRAEALNFAQELNEADIASHIEAEMPWDEATSLLREQAADRAIEEQMITPDQLTGFKSFLQGKADPVFLTGNYYLDDLVDEFKGVDDSEAKDLRAQYDNIDEKAYVSVIRKALIVGYVQAINDHPAVEKLVNTGISDFKFNQIGNSIEPYDEFYGHMKGFQKNHPALDEYKDEAEKTATELSKIDFASRWENALPWDEIAGRLRDHALQQAVREKLVPSEDRNQFSSFLTGKPDTMFLTGNFSVDNLVAEFKENDDVEDVEEARLVNSAVDDQMLDRIDHDNGAGDYLADHFPAAYDRFPDAFDAALTPEQFESKVLEPLEGDYLDQMKLLRKAVVMPSEYQDRANEVVSQLLKNTFPKLMEQAINLEPAANAIREKVADDGSLQVDYNAFLQFLQGKPDQMFLNLDYSLDDLITEFKGNQ